MIVLIGALLCGATTGIHVARVEDYPLDDAIELMRAMAKVIEVKTHRHAVIDDPGWERCASESGCENEIRARLSADDLLLVDIVGGPHHVLVDVDRKGTRHAAKLPRDRSDASRAKLLE